MNLGLSYTRPRNPPDKKKRVRGKPGKSNARIRKAKSLAAKRYVGIALPCGFCRGSAAYDLNQLYAHLRSVHGQSPEASLEVAIRVADALRNARSRRT